MCCWPHIQGQESKVVAVKKTKVMSVGGVIQPLPACLYSSITASPPGDPYTGRNSVESIHNSWQKHRDICLVIHALCSERRAEAVHHFVSQLLFVLALWLSTCRGTPNPFKLCRWPLSSFRFFCQSSLGGLKERSFEPLKVWGCSASNMSENFSSWLWWWDLLFLCLCLSLYSCCLC